MKNKSKELEVDYIGGQNDPLTKAELLSISAFIKQLKENRKKTSKTKNKKQAKVVAPH